MLAISDVVLRFNGVTALDGVTMQVRKGEICGVIGPNGAGKTSLFNCITGLYRPTTGSITFDEIDLLSLRPHRIVARGIARTFQNLALFPTLTVLENVIVGGHSQRPPRALASAVSWPPARRRQRQLERDAWTLLEELDLLDVAARPARGLPFGTLKRVELARALISRPSLVLLDEPAGGLTHSEVDELGRLIVRLSRQFEFGAMLVEHHMGLVMGISDRVVAMELGRTIFEGTPEEVRRSPAVVASYLGASA